MEEEIAILMEEPQEPAEESREEPVQEEEMQMQEEAPEAYAPLQEQDLREFVRQYPGLDPKSIPSSVWEAVRSGETLMGAYGRHELQQLRADNDRMRRELDVLSSNARSRENALGSMRSSGSMRAADGFLLGFDQA